VENLAVEGVVEVMVVKFGAGNRRALSPSIIGKQAVRLVREKEKGYQGHKRRLSSGNGMNDLSLFMIIDICGAYLIINDNQKLNMHNSN